MISLTTYAKQFPEAYQWTQKAIQADATDASAFYTAGFLDWSMSYPDYGAARKAAGMQPQDPGIIPDTALRQNFRVQHMSQIEDGHRMLQEALRLEPDYSDAMAYINLLYRIEAGVADTPAESAEMVARADAWVGKALDAKRKQAQNSRQPSGSGGAFEPLGPPPPPPPPPPPAAGQELVPGRMRVEGNVQQSKLLQHTPPVYPPAARQSGIAGTVSLSVVVGKDGRVQDIKVMGGPPPLIGSAVDAVRQWVYQPTLLNKEPVEVITVVNLTFSLQ